MMKDFETELVGVVAMGCVFLAAVILVGCAFSVSFDPTSGKVSDVSVTPVPELMLDMSTTALQSWLASERSALELAEAEIATHGDTAVRIHQVLVDGIIDVLTERGADAWTQE